MRNKYLGSTNDIDGEEPYTTYRYSSNYYDDDSDLNINDETEDERPFGKSIFESNNGGPKKLTKVGPH